MKPDLKYEMAIDRARDTHRAKLTPWELKFLTGLAATSRSGHGLTVKQKSVAYPILKRVGAFSP